jgi:GntR family transcriptional regulator
MKDNPSATPWTHWTEMSSVDQAAGKARPNILGNKPARATGDQRLPLYQLLRDDLAAKISAGAWSPGVPLPSEASLAESYGVSLGTMRHAIEELVDEGMLERRQGTGTFLRRPDFSSSMFRFFLFQSPDGSGLLPESRILSRMHVDPTEDVARQLQLAPGDKAIRMSRLRLYNGQPFVAEDIWLPYDRFRAFYNLPLTEIGPLLYPIYENVCGQLVATVEETLTIGMADGEQARLLGMPPGAPVAMIDRVARAHNGDRLEWRRSFGRGDRFSYKIEIR